MTTVAVKERPLLMSGPMVQEILADRKHQTRRVVKPQPELNGTIHTKTPAWWWPTKYSEAGYVHTDEQSLMRIIGDDCTYGVVGDRLWIREAFMPCKQSVVCSPGGATYVCFRDGAQKFKSGEYCPWNGKPPTWDTDPTHKFRPSIHQPRWASRITVEIAGIRVERLQSITWGDILAEGFSCPDHDFASGCCIGECPSLRKHFAAAWDKLNAKRGYSWKSNPFVWAIEFKRVN